MCTVLEQLSLVDIEALMNSKINAVKLKQDLTSKTAGIISNSHSLRKLSLLNCGSILVISAIVLAVSDCENTSAKKIIEITQSWTDSYRKSFWGG